VSGCLARSDFVSLRDNVPAAHRLPRTGGFVMEDRRQRLRALLAVDGDGGSSAFARIGALAVSRLAVTGAGVTLIRRPDSPSGQQLAWTSDPVAVRLEDLQLTVGEGPGGPRRRPMPRCWCRSWPPRRRGGQHSPPVRWPREWRRCSLSRWSWARSGWDRSTATAPHPAPLSPDQISDALVLADAAFAAVLGAVAGHGPNDLGWISDVHAEVHQACGMVMYQLKITIEEALLRIRARAHAYAKDLPIGVVARTS
jgi:hypothetical protein